MKKFFALAIAALAIASPLQASAATGNLNSDNHYQFYLSTDNNVLGTFIGQSDDFGNPSLTPPHDWQTAETFNFTLAEGVTHYLHVVVYDDTGITAGFLGSFDIESNFTFDNGSQHLATNTTDWTVYTDNFGGTTAPLVVKGTNGSAPWGAFASIDPNAQWLWTNQNGNGDLNTVRYFSARINPVVVPEPVSSALFLLGGTAFAAKRLRKKKNA